MKKTLSSSRYFMNEIVYTAIDGRKSWGMDIGEHGNMPLQTGVILGY